MRFPVYDANGNQHSYCDVSPYARGKLNKGMLPKDGKQGLFLPSRTPEVGETWLIVEGPKDAAVLHSLGYSAAGMTGCRLPKESQRIFAGCVVILVPDLDRPALRATVENGKRLESVVDSVRVARLPGELKPKGGDDVRDVIKRAGSEAVECAISDAEPFDADTLVDRPAVYIDIENAEIEVADKVIRILSACGFETNDVKNRMFQRGGKLVHVAEQSEDNGLQIIGLTKAGIRERITAAMDLMLKGDGDQPDRPRRPPGWLVDAIYDRPEYRHVRRLAGIVTAPTLRSDGTILQQPGYDLQSCLLYVPSCEFPLVPDSPTKENVSAAVTDLLEVVCDFPFRDEASRAVWLSLVLTLIGRSSIVGSVPLFGITANIRGSGKSKLADLASIIATGRAMARKSMPRTDEETGKVITAIAIESKPAILFDNAPAMVGGSSLDAVLTCDTWNDRILGKSETTGELPWRTVLMVTGNNLSFAADTGRRVVLCSLNCDHETPEDRGGFKYPNVEQYAKDNRARLVVAALTMLRAFVVAGRPYDGNLLGSFESWSETIAGAAVFAGLPNPLETVSVVREQDNSAAVFAGLLDGLAEVAGTDGLTAKQIHDGVRSIDSDNPKPEFAILRDVLAGITDKLSGRKIGNELKKYKGRILNGRRIVAVAGRAGVARWAVESIANAAEASTIPGRLPETENLVGNCDQCQQSLTATLTSCGGYLNRYCHACDLDHPCIAAP